MKIDWHYKDLPKSNPRKKYLVVYAPWDNNAMTHGNPRFEVADYYLGAEPNRIYKHDPWHLDMCSSVKERDVLAWADVGNPEDVVEEREKQLSLYDLISRKELLEELEDITPDVLSDDDNTLLDKDEVTSVIKHMSPAKKEKEWNWELDEWCFSCAFCDETYMKSDIKTWNYCPHCGAKWRN